MAKAVKFAVSIPGSEFKELEALRKKKGLTRSEFIRQTIKLWKEEREKQKLVKIYEEGYKRIPENLTAIEVWEKASCHSEEPTGDEACPE
jgi:metal-responsive CopG/Arc/MetJ family transcriptional regulator